jgi:hypothetical protein
MVHLSRRVLMLCSWPTKVHYACCSHALHRFFLRSIVFVLYHNPHCSTLGQVNAALRAYSSSAMPFDSKSLWWKP